MNKLKYIFLLTVCICAISSFGQQAIKSKIQVKRVVAYTDKVSGTVFDAATNKPLVGMNISVPGISAAMTDEVGKFSILVPSYDVELLISGPDYQKKRVALRGEKEISVFLYEETFKGVYGDIMTPLGEIANNHATASQSQLIGNNFLSQATNPDVLLQGTIAGLNTIQRSGSENSGANMFLRGFNSIYTSNQPLLIIDGMALENLSGGVSLIDGYLSTPLNFIDAKDIDRITIIKDAAAIYGTKGANGVILIETKRGKEPETHINVLASMGMNMKPSSIPMLNPLQSKNYLVDLYQSKGLSSSEIQKLPFLNNEKPVSNPWGYEGNTDYYRYNNNTNWQDQLFVEGFKKNYMLNISGGDNIALYALSVGYLQNEGVVSGTDFTRFTSRINSDINFSKDLTFHTSMSFVHGKKNLSQEGNLSVLNPIYSSLVKYPFTAANYIDEEGNSSPNLEEADVFGAANPKSVIENITQENTHYEFAGNVQLKYRVWKNLNLSTLFGLRFSKERERVLHPEKGIPYESLPISEVTNQLQHRVERILSYFSETRANYLFKFGHQHRLNTTVGLRYSHSSAEDDWGKAFNSPSDYFTSLQYGLNQLRQSGGSIGEWNWLAIYANASYSFKDKYFLTATTSMDASSRYGEDISTFQAFPEVTAAWLLSSENFMRDVRFLDMLKIRTSYSVTGNDDIGNYTARRYYVPQNLLSSYGLVRGNIVNKSLKPERVSKMNLGLDLSFLNERLFLSADVYRSNVKDMITYSSITPLSGFSTYIDNNGEMKNTGFDLSVNARLINTSKLKWDLGLTLSHYKNEITKLKGDEYMTEIADGNVLTRVGNPLGVFYGYKTQGVYSTETEANSAGLHIRSGMNDLPFGAGDMRFVNMNEDKYINEEDMTIIGDPNPDIYGGFNTSIKYNRISLSAQFTYSWGNDIYNYTRRTLESMSGLANQTQAVQNRWVAEGQITNIPKVTYADPMGNSRFSDRWIEDGSYLKFKNITISYDIPIKKRTIREIQVYGVVENIFTWTSYKGYDPEFNMSSNPLGYGIDCFVTPQTRTFYIGLRLGL